MMQASVQISAVLGDRVAPRDEVGAGVAESAGEIVAACGAVVAGAAVTLLGGRVGTAGVGPGVARSAEGFEEGGDAGEAEGGEGVGGGGVAGAVDDDDEAEGAGAALKGDAVVDDVGCNTGRGVTGGGDSTGAAVNWNATGGIVRPATGADTG